MSSDNDAGEMELDFQELREDVDDVDLDFQSLLEQEEAPPEAFYQALKNALAQLERSSDAAWG